jgi:Immunity protein 53
MIETHQNVLHWVQRYFQICCNEDWEHGPGIRIATLDNPGWRVKIYLRDTPLEGIPFERKEVATTDDDWYQCWRDDDDFNGVGGVTNLVSVLSVFRAWVEATAIIQAIKD